MPRLLATAALLLLAAALPAGAQEFTLDLSADGPLLSERVVQLFILVTVLSLVPGLAMMVTCFPFMVTVLAILRQGLGLQSSPPNMLIVTLALFLTFFVMEPTFTEAWTTGVQPMIEGRVETQEGLRIALEPFRAFMSVRVDPATLAEMGSLRGAEAVVPAGEAPLSVLVPSFLLSEIARAFQVGFLVFLPFLIIDLVVSAVLMSMGMMMVPPSIVALPFKLAFFVVADGWSLISSALVRSYM